MGSQSHSGSHLPTWPHDLSLLAPGTELRGGKMLLLSKNKGRFLNIFFLPTRKQLLSFLPNVTTILSPFQLTERKARHPGTTSQQGRSTQGLRPHTPGTLPVLPKTGQKTSLGISLDMHHAQEGGHGARSWTARLASHQRCYVVTTICKSQASLRQAAGIAGNPM